MSIFQFLRIIWARRLIVAAAMLSCVAGAVLVVLLVPPRYEAKARVTLDIFKPDPVTGEVLSAAAIRVFAQSQAELAKDYRVTGRVVDALNLTTDPGMVRLYQANSGPEQMDFRRWAAQRIADGTRAGLLEGSNILEITYSGPRPDLARAVAEEIREALVDVSVELRRETAIRNAEWYEAQIETARDALNKAESAKTSYERETGVVLPEGLDLESARLNTLAQAAGGVAAPALTQTSPLAGQLAQIDAAIAQAERQLGPNHPDLVTLRSQRAAVARQYAIDQARLSGASAGAGMGAVDRAVEAQKSRVIANRGIVERLRQLQVEVNVRREQFEKTSQRAAELRREAAAVDAGLSPLGSPVTPQSPSFPNKPLILAGSVALGFAFGLGVAVLVELFARRIRSLEDLASEIDAPVLAVIRAESKGRKRLTKMNVGPRAAMSRRSETA